jgi:hypothetical protein
MAGWEAETGDAVTGGVPGTVVAVRPEAEAPAQAVETPLTTERAGGEPVAAETAAEVAEAVEERKSPGRSRRAGFPLSLSAGLEANNNHRKGIALGAQVQADYRIFRFLAAGVRGGFSSNFGFSNTVEGEGFIRVILPMWGLEFFVQGGGGVSWIMIYEGNTTVPLFGGGTGVRIPLGPIYLEPAARFGKPFLWGAGVNVGVSFGER